MDRNLPITTDKRVLLTRLYRTDVSWEVCLYDWRQQKTYLVVAIDLSRVRVILKITVNFVYHYGYQGTKKFSFPACPSGKL